MHNINHRSVKTLAKNIDWLATLLPLGIILLLTFFLIFSPGQSTLLIDRIRAFIGNELGFYYILLGLLFFFGSLYIAFSRYGTIRLGQSDKVAYSSFKWGTMIFTSTMAADILFYSLCEWALYSGEDHIQALGNTALWAPTYPLFHWGPIAWSFYVVLAVAFGFMLHVRGKNKQKFSEGCRPLLGKYVDKAPGKIIDLFSIFALLAGTATTFSLATPLLSAALGRVLGIPATLELTVFVMVTTAVVYTLAVWFGMRGIALLATGCVYLFFLLLGYVLFAGGETVYIIETGIASLGNLIQNFLGLATWTDPLRQNFFPQNWSIFYWAYWMVWCVATPFFIGTISRGRTVKNVVLGAYGWGLAGTFTSFIILGNYGLAQELKHGIDISGHIARTGNIQDAILKIFDTLPLSSFGLILLVITMIAFYATTFDALTMVISSYSYKKLEVGQEPHKLVRSFWAILFILLPIGLLFGHNSMNSLQSVSIIAAFPMGVIVSIIAASFIKDAKHYLNNMKDQ